MKKQSATLISKLLNKNSQPTLQKEGKIVMLDARELVTNPKNETYSMEGIEELAAMIQFTQNIEPVAVKELPNGSFMLTSGHRRRLAQIYRFEHGMVEKPMLPAIARTIVNDFQGIITDDEMETLNIVFPNKGQRRNLSPSEEAAEIEMVRPILYKIYEHEKAAGNVEGKFRKFFAEFLQISEATLHRKESIGKVTEEIKAEIDVGNIKPTAAAELASMDKEQQNAVVQDIRDKGKEVTVEAVKQAKKKIVEQQTKEMRESPPVEETTMESSGNASMSVDNQESGASIDEETLPAPPSDDAIRQEANVWVREKIVAQLRETRNWLEMAEQNDASQELPLWRARVQRLREILNFLDGREDIGK